MKITPTRQVVLDTETTGMNKFGEQFQGHCIIEIGAVELINRQRTGRTLQLYIKPDRPVDPEAVEVHGITDEFLADKPSFPEVASEFLAFIDNAELIIHNATFDVGFIDYELRKHNLGVQLADICVVTDSLKLAKKLFIGKRNSLDALCARLNIDNSQRTFHGALLDAEILADVYLAMTGGQSNLFEDEILSPTDDANASNKAKSTVITDLPIIQASAEEIARHQEVLELISQKSSGKCLWLQE